MPSVAEALAETWPARLAQAIWGGVTLPRDVYQGRVDPLSQEGIGRATDLAGTVMGGTFGFAPRGAIGSGPVRGIRAYHGSPYDFDRFDMSKIGTGEGAQAYGHGLYFAENEGVAQSYRDALSGSRGAVPGGFTGRYKWLVGEGGEQMPPGIVGHRALDTAQDIDSLLYHQKHGSDPGMVKYLRESIERRIDRERAERAAELKAGYQPGGSAYEDMAALSDFYDRHLRGGKIPKIEERPPGRMYEVNINARPEQFLDWDRPLAEQPIAQAGLKRAFPAYDALPGDLMDWHNELRSYGPRSVQELSEAGIPGIRYLDQGSRAAGEGSRNYVLFRDDIIDILRKYGVAGALALGAGATANKAEAGQ